jgi:heat shock protein HslJ
MPTIRLAAFCAVAVVAGCSTESSGATTASRDPAGDVRGSNPSLTGTHWTLLAVGDTPLEPGATMREPFITLDAAEDRLSGSNGCNLVFARFTLRADAIEFSGIGATKMACAKGMEIETAFHDALSRAARYRIVKQQMELADPAGRVVARFAAPAGK